VARAAAVAAAGPAGWPAAGRRVPELAAALFLSGLFGLSFGLRYGVHNQHTYLLHGLHRADPALFARDWLVTQTTDYHPAFAFVVALLAAFGRQALPWAVALANVALLAAAGFLLWRLCRAVAPSATWPVYLLLAGSLVLQGDKDVIGSVAGSTLLTNYLAPSSFGALGLLAGMVLFVRRRWLASGAAVAVGGVFHVNFLVLAFPLFALAHGLAERGRLRQRLALQLAPCAAVLLARLPALLAIAGAPEAGAAREIFLTVRSPHHYVPLSFLPAFAGFFAWQAAGLLALARLERGGRGERGEHRTLGALCAAMMILIVAGTLLTTIVYIPVVAQLYVWRLAPFAVLLAQVCLAAALAMGASALPSRRVRPSHVLAAAGVVAFAVGAARGLDGLADQAARLSRPLAAADWVIVWARSTPRDSIFAVPPDFQEFRLQAERAVMVDWKSTPILPHEVLAWYRRVLAVSGREAVRSAAEAESGYATIGPYRMERLAREFDVDFVVVRQPFPRMRLRAARVAYADRRFIVFDTRRAALRHAP
jgi:hypothetical protein